MHEVRYPASFQEVALSDKMQVTVQQGPACRVEISAGGNILRNISTEVSEGRLLIDNRNTCNFVRGYKREIKVVVTLPHLRYLLNKGVGTVRLAQNFEQDTLVVRTESSGDIFVNGSFKQVRTSSHGNGDIFLSGRCNTFYVYTYGTNFVNAAALKVRKLAFIHTQSIGDCTVNADSLLRLEYNIENSGNIYYLGQPGAVADFSDPASAGRLLKK